MWPCQPMSCMSTSTNGSIPTSKLVTKSPHEFQKNSHITRLPLCWEEESERPLTKSMKMRFTTASNNSPPTSRNACANNTPTPRNANALLASMKALKMLKISGYHKCIFPICHLLGLPTGIRTTSDY